MKNSKQILCNILILLFFVEVSLWSSLSLAESPKIKVTCSFPILSLLVREIAKDHLEIKTLADSGEQIHHFEPSPKTLMDLRKSDLIFVNGLGMEHWLTDLQNQKDLKNRFIIVSEGITPRGTSHGPVDPHAWHNPEFTLVYLKNIKKALSSQYPAEASQFEKNFSTTEKKLKTWMIETRKKFESLPRPALVVTAHGAFNYLSNYWNLEPLALLGDHDEDSLSPKQLTRALKKIQGHPNRSFFGDFGDKDPLLKQWATQSQSLWGGELWGDALNSIGDTTQQAPPTLLDYLEHNTEVLLKAFTQKNESPPKH